MSRSLPGDPTDEEIHQAKGFIRQSAPWLDEDELTETAAWLAQRAREYHWLRALHLKPAQEKRALRRRTKALQALEKSARALRMASAELRESDGLPLRVDQLLQLNLMDAGLDPKLRDFWLAAGELEGMARGMAQVAQNTIKETENHKGQRGRRPDAHKDTIHAGLVARLARNARTKNDARNAANDIMVALKFPDVASDPRAAARVEQRAKKEG